MEHQALRAVLLTFLVATVVPCAASDANGPEREPDFIVTIGPKGVEENTQQVFFLGPSATLRVADESGKAIFLPQPASPDQDTEPSYNLAYVYENGHCNFEKILSYKDAFPGFPRQGWVRTVSNGSTLGKSPGNSFPIYTFTNPPAEYLTGVVSFCVRFTAPFAVTTTTTMSPTTATVTPTFPATPTHDDSAPSTESGGSSSQGGDSESALPGAGGGGVSPEEPHGDAAPPSAPDGDGGSSSSGENSQPQQTPTLPPQADNGDGTPSGSEDSQNSPEDNAEGAEGGGDDGSAGSSQGETGPSGQQTQTDSPDIQSTSSGDEPAKNELPQGVTNNVSPTPSDVSVTSPGKDQEQIQASGSLTLEAGSVDISAQGSDVAAGGARLRRLSDTDVSTEKYLTIVVHSAAWCLSAGSLGLSAAVLSMTGALLSSVSV
ncbi:Toxoplasma gondii family A protein [Toxoplasma gondii ME49]|uniref:SUSA n=3 Tax=Toxoplasma gondii TaxID=5811 RepID=B6KFT5_TOXGV|nr:Toxoplasma gondii family A protein [Toxoplasma gondii ME49]EPT30443.1 Toxoplasma gondii family A protein [Toxoplasma gondii ME49]ESS31586.1 Toxoplasma gondii family A protein [Toxoplasma gondii VEG]CEL73112.1 TPA: SUSA [Toxoplasma gondii VEG]|eukprot:XP_002366816.1 Toxoplasma gondii family A protein [Toxoplasma gondii ME49]